MGASSTPQTVLQFLAALEGALATHGHGVPEGARRRRGRRGAAAGRWRAPSDTPCGRSSAVVNHSAPDAAPHVGARVTIVVTG
jgi:hypothetical protein